MEKKKVNNNSTCVTLKLIEILESIQSEYPNTSDIYKDLGVKIKKYGSQLSKTKILQVCAPGKCRNKPLMNVEVGNKKYNFCCKAGFNKSLSDFTKTIS